MASFTGTIAAEVIEVRFAFSGKIVWVKKKPGEPVKQWEAIASLDRKLLQAELDRQLADYEKVRAEFEIFGIKNGKEGGDDITKFLRQEKQASLNISVKDVEIAKYKLDQADLISPVEGIILNTEGLTVGLHTTPAASAVQILHTSSIYFSFTIEQEQLHLFTQPTKIQITIPHTQIKYEGESTPPFIGDHGSFVVRVPLRETAGLLPGMKGKGTLV